MAESECEHIAAETPALSNIPHGLLLLLPGTGVADSLSAEHRFWQWEMHCRRHSRSTESDYPHQPFSSLLRNQLLHHFSINKTLLSLYYTPDLVRE